MGGTAWLDVDPLSLAGFLDCDSVCGRAPASGAFAEPERAISPRLRSTGSHGGRSINNLGANAAGEGRSVRRLSHPKYSTGGFQHQQRYYYAARLRAGHGVRCGTATVPPLGCDDLARRCGSFLGATGGGLDGRRAYAVDAGAARAAGMAADAAESRRPDWCLSSGTVAGLRAGAGAGGGRLASSGRA